VSFGVVSGLFRCVGRIFLCAVAWSAGGLPSTADVKVALVVGNADYQQGPDLKTPLRDSTAVFETLVQLGYEAVLLQDANRVEFMTALAQLRVRSANADKVLIYFAGHGLQQSGENHLLTVDSDFVGQNRFRTMVSLGVLIRSISDKPRQKLIFIDACRDNPAYEPQVLPNRSTRKHVMPAGLFLAYASQSGAPVFDGRARHSPFTKAFLKHAHSGLTLNELARQMRVSVIRQTQGQQIPWTSSSLLRQGYLH